MSQVITATFENGVLKPDQPLDLRSGARVRIMLMEPEEPLPESVDQLWQELEQLCEEYPIDSGGVPMTRDQLHERR